MLFFLAMDSEGSEVSSPGGIFSTGVVIIIVNNFLIMKLIYTSNNLML